MATRVGSPGVTFNVTVIGVSFLSISMSVVAEAAGTEFRKLDLPVPDSTLSLIATPQQPRLGAGA